MDKSALCSLVMNMRATLRARESQLETKFREVTDMQEVTQSLMVPPFPAMSVPDISLTFTLNKTFTSRTDVE